MDGAQARDARTVAGARGHESEKAQLLGRYVLHGEIAAGGMATVHLGRLVAPVGSSRTVAIKRLHRHLAADPEFVTMFLDEARIAARVRHPNVVATLDAVTVERELFLVMEYVAGEALSQLIRLSSQRGGPVPPPIAAAIVVGALHGLHAAHEARDDEGRPLGIVHRDVSPHNVLVGIDGVPRVLDFGVAKAVGRSQVTREGQLKGKLPYMAPEQVRRRGEVTRRTDVYAASVVLWEALTARRLFSADEETQILAAVLDGNVEPPSRYAPGLPRALDELVLRGLSSDPSARYATARDMADAIARVVPLASEMHVGQWVVSLVADVLEQRAAWIARVESGDDDPTREMAAILDFEATRQDPFPAALSARALAITRPMPPAPPPRPGDSANALTQRHPDRVSPLRSNVAAGFALGGIFAAAAAILLLMARREDGATTPPHDVVPAATPSVSGSAVVAAVSTTVIAPPATIPDAPAVTPATIDETESAVPKSIPIPSTAAKPSTSAPPAKPSAKPAVTIKPPKKPPSPCDPNFYYDHGIKIFKPECM